VISFGTLSSCGLRLVGLSVLALSLWGCGLDLKGDDLAGFGGGVVHSGGASSGGASSGGGGAATGGSGGGAAGAAGNAAGAGSCLPDEQCVPAVPQGWSFGFLAGADFSPTAPPGETCWDGAAPHRYYANPSSGAECAPCSCGPLANGSCKVPLLCSNNTSCSSFQDYSQGNGDCQYKSGGGTLACMMGTPTIVSPGSCAPSGGDLVVVDTWTQIADLCTVPTGGQCGASMQCLPRGGGSYAGYACAYMPGDQTCPAGYDARTVVYGENDFTDTRSCSACTCTVGTPQCVGAEYEFFDDGLCIEGSTKVNSTSCKDLSSTINAFWPAWSYRKRSDPVVTGSCAPVGGTPAGALTVKSGVGLTVCCRNAG
jgi:hypothetical protein